jgi:hypothetical protein
LGPRGPIPVLGCGGERAGEGRRRRPGTVAAAAGIPAAWARCRGRAVGRLGSYCRCEGRWGAARFGTQLAGACSSPWRAPRAAQWRAGEGRSAAWHDVEGQLSYGPPWAHYLGGYQDRLLGGPLGLPDLRCMTPDGVKHRDYGGEVLG